MPKLTLNYCTIADVEQIVPKPDDPQQKDRKVTILADEEDLFRMLDGINPKTIIKYLDMRGIPHRQPANILVRVTPDASGLKLRHQLNRIKAELRDARNDRNGCESGLITEQKPEQTAHKTVHKSARKTVKSARKNAQTASDNTRL